jgi:hypothetical protein
MKDTTGVSAYLQAKFSFFVGYALCCFRMKMNICVTGIALSLHTLHRINLCLSKD